MTTTRTTTRRRREEIAIEERESSVKNRNEEDLFLNFASSSSSCCQCCVSVGSKKKSEESRRSWKWYKSEGRRHFECLNYKEAVEFYTKAAECCRGDDVERQILWSNVVACRLRVVTDHRQQPKEQQEEEEGHHQALLALEAAEKCVRLNPNWARGHMRVAESNRALGRSNETCNALQRALALDNSYAQARKMLIAELRRDHRPQIQQLQNDSHKIDNVLPHQQTQLQHHQKQQQTDVLLEELQWPSQPSVTSDRYLQNSSHPVPQTTSAPHFSPDIDDSPSLFQRLRFYWSRMLCHWYNQYFSGDGRALLNMLLAFIVLCIIFDGRFHNNQHTFQQPRQNQQTSKQSNLLHSWRSHSAIFFHTTLPRTATNKQLQIPHSTHNQFTPKHTYTTPPFIHPICYPHQHQHQHQHQPNQHCHTLALSFTNSSNTKTPPPTCNTIQDPSKPSPLVLDLRSIMGALILFTYIFICRAGTHNDEYINNHNHYYTMFDSMTMTTTTTSTLSFSALRALHRMRRRRRAALSSATTVEVDHLSPLGEDGYYRPSWRRHRLRRAGWAI